MLFLHIIFVLCIYFIAYNLLFFFNLTLQTLPKPPLPIAYRHSKLYLLTSFSLWLLSIIFGLLVTFYSFLCLNLDRSIFSIFLNYRPDLLDIVELLRLCSFDLFITELFFFSLLSFMISLPVIKPCRFMLILLNRSRGTASDAHWADGWKSASWLDLWACWFVANRWWWTWRVGWGVGCYVWGDGWWGWSSCVPAWLRVWCVISRWFDFS